MMLGANVSYAGVAEILYFERRTGRIYVLDAGWGTWRGEHSPATIPNADISAITGRAPGAPGAAGRKALVPGFMAGMQAFHDRFGRLPLRRPVRAGDLVCRAWRSGDAHARRLFRHGAADPRYQPRRAAPSRRAIRTAALRPSRPCRDASIGRAGGRALHVSRRLGAALCRRWSARAAARRSMEDMDAYRPRWTEPLSMPLSGATLFGPDAANSNGCAIMMALNLLDHRPAAAPYWQDPAAFRTAALALRASFFAPYAPEIAAFERRTRPGRQLRRAGHARLWRGGGGVRSIRWRRAAARSRPAITAPRSSRSIAGATSPHWSTPATRRMWGDTGMIVDGVPVPTPPASTNPASPRSSPAIACRATWRR